MKHLFRSTLIALAGTLPLAPDADAQVSGRVLEQSDGQFLFRPSDLQSPDVLLQGSSETIENLSRLPQVQTPEGTLADVPRFLADRPLEAQLPSVSAFRSNHDILRGPQFGDLNRAIDQLEGVADLAKRQGQGEMGVDDGASVIRSSELDAAEAATRAMQSTVQDPSSDPAAIDALREILARLEEEIKALDPPDSEQFDDLSSVEKALYADSREYSPHIYRRIASNTQGVVGIGEVLLPGQSRVDVHCSGAIIGEGLVATARHCLFDKSRRRNHLRVVLDYEVDPFFPFDRRELDILDMVAMGEMPEDRPSQQLDYALLKVGEAPPQSIFWTSATEDPPDGSSRQLCLSTATSLRDEEIYVVSHPEARERRVADSGKVLFPYLADQTTLGWIHKSVIEELVAHTTSNAPGAEKYVDLLKRWAESYEEREDGLFVHNSRVFRGQPTLGIQSNTFGGSSGGPVFSKRHNLVVGIFRAGEFDGQQVYQGGWEYHESALPIELVIRDMNRRQPGWLEHYKVCAWGMDDDNLQLWSDDQELMEHCKQVCR